MGCVLNGHSMSAPAYDVVCYNVYRLKNKGQQDSQKTCTKGLSESYFLLFIRHHNCIVKILNLISLFYVLTCITSFRYLSIICNVVIACYIICDVS